MLVISFWLSPYYIITNIQTGSILWGHIIQNDDFRLTDFAFCGATEGFNNMIQYLSDIAEKEIWTFSEKPNEILIKYINGTFKRCYAQQKIAYNSNWACMNTGLLTPNGNDIIMMFVKNEHKDAQEWFLKGFYDRTDRQFMSVFKTVPELATYTDKFEELFFNPDYNIEISSDHILDDNWERIYEYVKLPKQIVKTLMIGILEETKKKVERNMRLVVPQFYNNQIMFLMPIRIPISENEVITMALAVEKIESNQYRGNTIFTKEVAYEKARLLMKPESNWLINN